MVRIITKHRSCGPGRRSVVHWISFNYSLHQLSEYRVSKILNTFNGTPNSVHIQGGPN